MRTAAVILSSIGIILFAGCKKNHTPDKPSVPSGPTSCAVGVEYNFSSSATDPDGDSVSVRFDWGDGDTSDWSPYAASGETLTIDHSWSSYATCNVRAQAKDRRSAGSSWSDACIVSVAQRWTLAIGGSGDDRGRSVQQTEDGGYVVAAVSQAGALWLIKASASGDTDWIRSYGGDSIREGYSAQQTQDGGYIIAGLTLRTGDHQGVYLVKTSADGNMLWDTMMGQWGDIVGYSVEQTRDGGYIIGGAERSVSADWNLWLEKADQNGNEVWNRTIHASVNDGGCSAHRTQDGGYALTGYTASFGAGSADVWLVKTDSSGDTTWTRTFGGTSKDEGLSMQQTQDGGYIITGYTSSFGAGVRDVWLIKTDATGSKLWDKTYGGTGDDVGNSVHQTADGGYVVVGYTSSFGAGDYDVWILKTDADGDTAWTRTFGADGDDEGYSGQQAADGGYIIAGYTESYGAGGQDVWLIKVDAAGLTDGGSGK